MRETSETPAGGVHKYKQRKAGCVQTSMSVTDDPLSLARYLSWMVQSSKVHSWVDERIYLVYSSVACTPEDI